MTWREQAMCRNYDPKVFFPRVSHSGGNVQRVRHEHAKQIKQAKRICAMCPVDLECLDYALQLQDNYNHKSHGCIWGGTTYAERVEILDARVTARCVHGHLLDGQNTWVDKSDRSHCRTCNIERRRRERELAKSKVVA